MAGSWVDVNVHEESLVPLHQLGHQLAVAAVEVELTGGHQQGRTTSGGGQGEEKERQKYPYEEQPRRNVQVKKRE